MKKVERNNYRRKVNANDKAFAFYLYNCPKEPVSEFINTSDDCLFNEEYRTILEPEKEYYHYHPDHLGSSSWITDPEGRPVQHIQYLPFGETWADQRSANWNAPYTFSGKEKDWESSYHYYGARYYDSEISIWLVPDPLRDKYPSLSPYVYCANNPVKLIDPDGKSYGNFYDMQGKFLYTDGIDDGKIYEVSTMPGFTSDVAGNGVPVVNYVAQVADVKMSYTGSANSDRPAMTEGKLDIIEVGTNGKEYTRMSVNAVGGPYGNGSPPNGDYSVDNPRKRSESGFTSDGVGFSFDLNPKFNTKRTHLRIHPDGNNKGTLGCIGLRSYGEKNLKFYNLLKSEIEKRGSIDLNININGNPNNHGGGVVPLINE